MYDKVITLRSVYKVKTYHIQPCKQPNGQNYPWVKPVSKDAAGNSIMLVSDAERNSSDYAYFIPEDLDITITEGTTFDLSNPYDRNRWKAIEHCGLIAPMRGARDEKGELIIDGNKRKYGLADFWIDVPGEETQQTVDRKKLIFKAHQYIYGDSDEGRQTKCKLLGKIMRNAPSSDVTDFLLKRAEKDPKQIIEFYTSSDSMYRILVIDAKDKGIIRKIDGLFMYADNALGSTDESMISFLKTPGNIRVFEAVRNETYPDMVRKIETLKLDDIDPNLTKVNDTEDATAKPVAKSNTKK